MNFNPFSYLFREVNSELPDIFPVPIAQNNFVMIDTQTTFSRILTDVVDRTHGLSEEQQNLIWDNCLGSEKQDGLITLLAKAMSSKSELFIVYFPTLKLIRTAEAKEIADIRDGYKKKGEPVSVDNGGIGVYITFKNFVKADIIKFYSMLEFTAAGSLWKQANISKVMQLKFSELRSSTGLNDKADLITQAQKLAQGMAIGRDIMADAKDIFELAKVDMTATNSLVEFIDKKKGFYLGLPASYMGGDLAGGLGDSGKADSKAIDKGLKTYFVSIIKPVFDGLFSKKTKFKEEDTGSLETGLNVLKTMDITSNEYMNKDNKTLIVNKAFGLDDNQKGEDSPEPTNGNDPTITPGGPIPPKDPKNSPPPKV